MHKLPPVEEAKRFFEEAKEWGMFQWLAGKRRARQTADAAWEALDECERQVKASWRDDVQKAYREQETQAAAAADGRARRSFEKAREEAKGVAPEIKAAAQKLLEADAEAYKARMDAEAQFDEADRKLSTSMAREGSQMAIDAWLMREKFIRKMEALGRR
ncbi:MAG TPA: hypothetical protein VGS58_22335 [Candidatus Sulfopaludibacter sp.]|nr:hypothetical protein [Candidatus Sulfopaludibacter sp.]